MLSIWHINVYTLPHWMGLCCTRVSPTEHAPSQGYTWLSRDVRQNTLGQTFWQSGPRHRGAYQNDEFTTRPAALKRKTPETRNRIYWGSHMQHIYRESTIGATGTFIAGGLTEQ